MRGRSEFEGGLLPITYSGYFHNLLLKCFGIEVQDKEIVYNRLNLGLNLFPNGNRPGLGQDMRLIAFFHRPNEFLAEPRIRKAKWPHRSTNTSYRMKFIMTKVEVLERRNKRNLPCIDDRVNYDQQAYNDHVKRIGCKPPYLNVHGNYSNCKSIQLSICSEEFDKSLHISSKY